jgi:ribosomal protein S18 acetylase RimI-like enzyme
MTVSIRTLLDTDLAGAEKILSSAFQRSHGWITDLCLYRKVQPDGYFLAEQDGEPVGMLGATIYSSYSYIGLMAVQPDYQKKGIGRALMQHVLAWLDERQVPLVMLDASPAGQPLYESLGFAAYEKVEVLERSGGGSPGSCPTQVRPIQAADLGLISVADTNAFGADRSRVLHLLLETYPGRAFLLPEAPGIIAGHVFAQENRIGPWVMQDDTQAELLLQAALSLPFPGPVTLAVPGENTKAIQLLRRHGFKSVRINRHMGRGLGKPGGNRGMVYAQSSLSLG